MIQQTVLVIEDERDIRDIIRSTLEEEGFKVYELPRGEEALQFIRRSRPDVVLVDQILPGKRGTEVIQEVRMTRAFQLLPMILVTGCDSEAEKVSGLTLGADDYITKPFSRKELIARVKACLRRSQITGGTKQGEIHSGTLKVNLSSHRATLSEVELRLTLTEFKILVELMSYDGKVLSRADLCDRVLGRANVTDRTIDVHIAALRKKLGARGDEIETVRGVGYRFGGAIQIA